jgi:DNA-binding FadR family transcriptional regulator
MNEETINRLRNRIEEDFAHYAARKMDDQELLSMKSWYDGFRTAAELIVVGLGTMIYDAINETEKAKGA